MGIADPTVTDRHAETGHDDGAVQRPTDALRNSKGERPPSPPKLHNDISYHAPTSRPLERLRYQHSRLPTHNSPEEASRTPFNDQRLQATYLQRRRLAEPLGRGRWGWSC